ncbi:hypothetical protein MAMMFC1_01926 [Methylomusa anaerophila]|uniref:Threonine/Serine exporter ThrE domain-containing protein n=2 Tax=Methylomusa anaerophila TaxID=1930071 RepID=A0A348AJK7_9FIRM|nr:hypothetical protein MAMMFC1_01926 [Methylomusa anaerophila]
MGVAVGILYRIPRALLLYASVTGAIGWLVMHGILVNNGNVIFANFVGSMAVGAASELFARLLKKPATIFIVPGFIPLVPGREAYTTMLYMVDGRYPEGVSMGMLTMLTAGAIAFGLFVSATVYRLLLQNIDAKDKKDKRKIKEWMEE